MMPMSMIVAVIAIIVLLPLAIWLQRLQARGVISDDRPLDRVIRERLTGKPARLARPHYRRSRLRFYGLVLVGLPVCASVIATAVAAITKPHDALGLVIGPAFVVGLIVLGISEDRYTGVSRRQRVVLASFAGLVVAMLALLLIAGVDPHATLSGSGG